MTTCSIYSLGLTIAIVLIIAFADDIFTHMPILSTIFTDAVNFVLLIVLCIMVLLLDMPSGILLAFLILYLSIWVKQWLRNKKERFTDIILTSNPLSDIPRANASEPEINYATPDIPNRNISPFQPQDQTMIKTMTPQIRPDIACNQNDSLSQVGPLNRDGYDCTGCRYDMKDSPQNLTKWGQPLSRCSTYDASKVSKIGTVFYPLHA
jgi:hypothetical protein